MSGVEKLNVAIAVGDLSTAAAAAVGTQLLGGGLAIGNLPLDILTVGGTALVACQVADIIEPRINSIIAGSKAYQSVTGGYPQAAAYAMRAGVAAGTAHGLFWTAGMLGANPFSLRAFYPSLVIGASCVAGHYVTDMYLNKMPAPPAK